MHPIDHQPSSGVAGKVVRGSIWSALGLVISRISRLAGNIALARLVLPEEVGHYAIAYSTVSILTLPLDVGLSRFLPLRSKAGTAWLRRALPIYLGSSLLLGLVALALLPGFDGVQGPLLATAVLIECLSRALTHSQEVQLAQALRFKELAGYRAVQSISTIALQVGFALLSFGSFGLFVAHQASNCFTLLLRRRSVRLPRWKSPSLRTSGILLREMLGVSSPQALQRVIVELPALLGLVGLVSDSVIGVYRMSSVLSVQVMNLVNAAYTGIVIPALSAVKEGDERSSLSRSMSRAVWALGSATVILQAGALPVAVSMMGDRWDALLPVSFILTCSIIFRLQNTLAEPMLLMAGRLRAVSMVALVTTGSMIFGVATITLGEASPSAIHLATLSAMSSALSAALAWRSVYALKAAFLPMAIQVIFRYGTRPTVLLGTIAVLVLSGADLLGEQLLIFGAALGGAVYQLWAETRGIDRVALVQRVTGGRLARAFGGRRN